MRIRNRWLSALVTLGVLAAAPRARAQTEQETAARNMLLEQAQAARAHDDHAGALEAILRAGRIRMTPSVRLFIAEEHESLGHLAEALGSADACVREATRDPTLRTREVIINSCNALVARLRPRVGQVTVRVPTPAPAGLHVTVAGAEMLEALFGVPYLVNPGAVRVEARAPGRVHFATTVNVSAGAVVPVEVALPEGRDDVADAGSAPPRASGSTGSGPREAHPAGQGGGPGAAPIVVLSAGVLSLGAAAVFFVLRNDGVARCVVTSDNIVCPDEASAASARDAQTWNLLTNVTLGVGAAAVAAGGVWLVVSLLSSGSRSSEPARRATIDFAPLPGGGLLEARGAF